MIRYMITPDNGTHHFEFGLDFAQLASRQHLDVRTDLFSRPCLAGAKFYIPGDQFVAPYKNKKKKRHMKPQSRVYIKKKPSNR